MVDSINKMLFSLDVEGHYPIDRHRSAVPGDWRSLSSTGICFGFDSV